MKKILTLIFLLSATLLKANAQTDSIFNRTIYNKEYDIYMKINFYEKNVSVPQQDIYGEMAGYIGDYKDFRKWFILEADIKKNTNASLVISNDEGSEDLEATLTYNSDGTYTLKQETGSTLKIARNRKWKKLPATIVFIKNRQADK